MWNAILPAYKHAIDGEHDKEVLADQLHGIAQCVEELGPSLVTQEQMEVILDIVNSQMVEYAERANERGKERDEDDDDEDAVEAMSEEMEEEAGVLARISDIIHCLFQAFGQNFVPYFEKLVQHFLPLLGPRRHHSERQWVICIFDDLIEFGGEASLKYHSSFYGPMLAALSDEYPEVRQAAAYGFGIMGQQGGNAYAQACAGEASFPLLNTRLEMLKPRIKKKLVLVK